MDNPAAAVPDGAAFLVIAAYSKTGHGTIPSMDDLAKILAKLLVGDMGLFLVYSTQPADVPPEGPPLPPVDPPAPPVTDNTGRDKDGNYWVKRRPELATLNYYATVDAPHPFSTVATRWGLKVLERTDGPHDRLLVFNTPKLVIWVDPAEVIALSPAEIALVEANPGADL